MSRSMSLALITCVPAITAIRSRITAPESSADHPEINKAEIQIMPRMLESLPYRKEKLEMADILRRALAVTRQLRKRNIRIAV